MCKGFKFYTTKRLDFKIETKKIPLEVAVFFMVKAKNSIIKINIIRLKYDRQ